MLFNPAGDLPARKNETLHSTGRRQLSGSTVERPPAPGDAVARTASAASAPEPTIRQTTGRSSGMKRREHVIGELSAWRPSPETPSLTRGKRGGAEDLDQRPDPVVPAGAALRPDPTRPKARVRVVVHDEQVAPGRQSVLPAEGGGRAGRRFISVRGLARTHALAAPDGRVHGMSNGRDRPRAENSAPAALGDDVRHKESDVVARPAVLRPLVARDRGRASKPSSLSASGLLAVALLASALSEPLPCPS
jgi:hypothetical protein